MKIKWTWALFVPFFIIMAVLKVYQTVFLPYGGTFLGMNNTQLTYLNVILGAALFLLCVLLSLLDKKTADIIPPSRSIVSALLAILTAVSIVLCSALDIYGMYINGVYVVLWLISGVLGFFAAISLIIGAIAMFTGTKKSKGISVLFLLPAIWSAAQLIATFSQFTWLSVRTTDMTVIVAYVFRTMFLFYQAAALTVYDEKSTAKKNFVFGLPAITLLTVCGISAIVTPLKVPEAFSIEGCLLAAQLIITALFVLSFLIHASRNLISRDDVVRETPEQETESDVPSEDEQNNFRSVTDMLEEDDADSDLTFTISQPVESEAPATPAQEQEKGGFTEANEMLNKLLEDL